MFLKILELDNFCAINSKRKLYYSIKQCIIYEVQYNLNDNVYNLNKNPQNLARY